MRQVSHARTVLEEVFSPQRARELWSAGYGAVLPVTPQDFALEAILPVVLYMFRWGHRRGVGKFLSAFDTDHDGTPTIDEVATSLAAKKQWFKNFDSEIGKAILGDLLLTYCLENREHATGRSQQIIRAFPTHYFASWIDLPNSVANLRFVPEMIVALLVDQSEGSHIQPGQVKSRFSAGTGIDQNDLLKLLGTGVYSEGYEANVAAERFDEASEVGIDQLLTIRIAQSCGQAPQKMRGARETVLISNARPISRRASRLLARDFSVFIQAYGSVIPRPALIPMLESCLCIGLTNIFLSSAALAMKWEKSSQIDLSQDDLPWGLFVDCSSGSNNDLRRVSEESLEDCFRRLDRLPTVLMTLRVLEQVVAHDEDLRREVQPLKDQPVADGLLNLLGRVRLGEHDEAIFLLKKLKEKCRELADALESDDEYLPLCELLRNTDVDPATRLGETLAALMGDKLQRGHFLKFFDSASMLDSPSGLTTKRKIMISSVGKRRLTDARSVVLTNTMIDFLVHRHLRKDKKGKGEKVLSLQDFLVILRERYGLFVDRAPEGMQIANQFLAQNKKFLERRLRDLGLLEGVNDAETMKRLTPRYSTPEE